jgi:hypothetical protein
LARKKGKGTELGVFKGREARLNRAIFQTLSIKGAETIYEMHKNVRAARGLRRTHYGNVNKRMKALEQLGYLRIVRVQHTKAGFDALVYELTTKAYLVHLLNSISIEELVNQIDENSATEVLAAIVEITRLE